MIMRKYKRINDFLLIFKNNLKKCKKESIQIVGNQTNNYLEKMMLFNGFIAFFHLIH